MKKNKIALSGLLSVALVVGILLIACPTGGIEDPNPPPPPPLSTRDFNITHDPASRTYTTGATITPLTVVVEPAGTYEYQWYSTTATPPAPLTLPPADHNGWTAIDDATTASYTPTDTAAGDYFYRCEVKKSEITVNSRPVLVKITAAAAVPPVTFTINDTKYNYVRGFGGTGAFMFRQGGNADASPDVDVEYIDKLMDSETGVGANILRIMVQDDYLNYITGAIQSQNVAVFPHDPARNFFPVIRRVNEWGGYVFANPWTAPAYMKLNNAVIGGQNAKLRAGMQIPYANHLRNFVKWLNENDAPIYAIGLLNEPDFGGSSDYEGMEMSGTEMRDVWKLAGHITTQRVTNPGTAVIDGGVVTSRFAEELIPGWGGGKATHHVLTMSGDTMGETNHHDDTLRDAVANLNVELFGRHNYNSRNRFTRIVGAQGTAWADRPITTLTQTFTPKVEGTHVQGKREVWMTEHDFNAGRSTVAESWIYTWAQVFPVMNAVDNSIRVNDESAYVYWYSQHYSGMVSSVTFGGWQKGQITTRGRAYAHYARFAKETWRLGVTREGASWNFNPIYGTTGDPGIDEWSNNISVKASAFLDFHKGDFISVVMFTPSLPGVDDGQPGTAVNVGPVRVKLPDGYTASTAYALKSYGRWGKGDPQNTTSEDQYWLDEAVLLSADGTYADVTLPASTIISIKFMLNK